MPTQRDKQKYENTNMPKYRRHHLLGHPVFVTLITRDRLPWLATEPNAELVLSAMRNVKAIHPFRQLAYVILPDHVHWMFLPDTGDFSIIVAAVKRGVSAGMKERPSESLWQNRFYDHVIRDEDDFGRHMDYIHYNPVKHGHAGRPADHRHSSFRQWVARGVYPDGWGETEPGRLRGMELE